MPDHVWYFARGDEEKGPFTEAQIRSLVGAGKVRDEDLVWKEGMRDWLPARDVPGLMAPMDEPPSDTDRPLELGAAVYSSPVRGNGQRSARRELASPSESQRFLMVLGRLLFAGGLLVLLLAQGCGAIGQQNVLRMRSKTEQAKFDFEGKWYRQLGSLEHERDQIKAKLVVTTADQQRLQTLEKQIAQMEKQKLAEQEELTSGKWRALEADHQQAELNQTMWSFWRKTAFVAASLVFAAGLLLNSATRDGAERWLSLVMLAILAYSLFVGGDAWG